MPKKRDFPREYFEGNPFEGMSPQEIYEKIQWGKAPEAIREIDAPEPLVGLGRVARIQTADGRVYEFEDGEKELAVGAYSNMLFVFPVGAEAIPGDGYEPIGVAVQTDYYSEKGDEEGYYYHHHEEPFPTIWTINKEYWLLVPESEDGERSYAVAEEGIIG